MPISNSSRLEWGVWMNGVVWNRYEYIRKTAKANKPAELQLEEIVDNTMLHVTVRFPTTKPINKTFSFESASRIAVCCNGFDALKQLVGFWGIRHSMPFVLTATRLRLEDSAAAPALHFLEVQGTAA